MSNNPYSNFFRNGPSNFYKTIESSYRFEPGALDGTSDPSIPFLPLFSPVIPSGTTGYAKVWDGSAWVKKPVKVWTGSAWEIKPVKHWNGSAWVTTL